MRERGFEECSIQSVGTELQCSSDGFCVGHMAANFMNQFGNSEGKRYLKNAAYSPSLSGEDHWMKALAQLSPEMYAWARSDHKGSLDEGTRRLLVAAIMRATHERLQQLLIRKGREAMTQISAGQEFSQYLIRAIEKLRESLPNMRVAHCDRQSEVFSVDELQEMEGYGMLWHPVLQLDSSGGRYVDPVYKIQSVFSVYRVEFPPIPEE
ncbi:hypothetical protein PIB30_102983 [Stylosanthes scabra]|uniref:Uncharacterized protein n=1 Tax=Stylosanthes scabra TaxID=79078 RepID=A0ABU6UXJ8_9FABA|nr:hypothetical protein [Stylosanthes scabra]